jgi:hypothetical protein
MKEFDIEKIKEGKYIVVTYVCRMRLTKTCAEALKAGDKWKEAMTYREAERFIERIYEARQEEAEEKRKNQKYARRQKREEKKAQALGRATYH